MLEAPRHALHPIQDVNAQAVDDGWSCEAVRRWRGEPASPKSEGWRREWIFSAWLTGARTVAGVGTDQPSPSLSGGMS